MTLPRTAVAIVLIACMTLASTWTSAPAAFQSADVPVVTRTFDISGADSMRIVQSGNSVFAAAVTYGYVMRINPIDGAHTNITRSQGRYVSIYGTPAYDAPRQTIFVNRYWSGIDGDPAGVSVITSDGRVREIINGSRGAEGRLPLPYNRSREAWAGIGIVGNFAYTAYGWNYSQGHPVNSSLFKISLKAPYNYTRLTFIGGGVYRGFVGDSSGRVWFLDTLEQTVLRFDPVTNRITVEARLGGDFLDYMAISNDVVYVDEECCGGNGTQNVIDEIPAAGGPVLQVPAANGILGNMAVAGETIAYASYGISSSYSNICILGGRCINATTGVISSIAGDSFGNLYYTYIEQFGSRSLLGVATGMAPAAGSSPRTPLCTRSRAVGTPVVCRASVVGPSPTGSITWTAEGGRLSRLSCPLVRGTCSVVFTPTSASTALNITASYSGDSHNLPSYGVAHLVASPVRSRTAISCRPATLQIGSGRNVTCTARVAGYHPTGTVLWSQAGTGSVTFGQSMCVLSMGFCSVNATAAGSGSAVVHASYGGDRNDTSSLSNGAGVRVVRRASGAVIAASTVTPARGGAVLLTAYLADRSPGTPQAPTGVVLWGASRSGGAFGQASCTLAPYNASTSSCRVFYIAPILSGPMTITISCRGDLVHTGAIARLRLAVG